MERATSLEKALEICEALSVSSRGLTVSELARALELPPPTVHRLLKVLKRRGYVRQDDETTRYALTLKMLDLSFRLMGRSELRLHAYPVIREHVLRTAERAFFAVPAAGEVTYIWRAGPDEVGTYTAYGREMPGHCAMFFTEQDREPALRRLSCIRLQHPREVADPSQVAVRLGAPLRAAGGQRMLCTCAPVWEYTGREVARLGLFTHAPEERGFVEATPRGAWDLARQVSQRLGYLPTGQAMSA